jgi:hypothetical protein
MVDFLKRKGGKIKMATIIDFPLNKKEAPKAPPFNYTGHGHAGSRYDRELGTKEIAAEVRKHLKKKFKDCKFSITIERYAGGSSINARLMEGPFKAILNRGSIKGGY